MRPPVFFLLLAAVAALPIPEDQNELVSRVLKDYYTGFGVGLGVEAMDRFQKEQRSKNQASNTPPQQVRKSGIEQSQQQARDPPANHGPSSYSWYALETDEERQRWDECMRKQKVSGVRLALLTIDQSSVSNRLFPCLFLKCFLDYALLT